MNGSPNDLGDLLRAGVEHARAAVILSTRKPTAGGNPGEHPILLKLKLRAGGNLGERPILLKVVERAGGDPDEHPNLPK